MLEITSLRVNHQLLGEELRTHFCTARGLSFSWGVRSGCADDRQASCRVLVTDEASLLWDSGIVETDEQLIHYAGSKLPEGRRLLVTVQVTSTHGETSEEVGDYFFVADTEWSAPWIGMESPEGTKALYFRKEVIAEKAISHAELYVCGIGYQKVYLNGEALDACTMDPAVTQYIHECQYVLYPELETKLTGKDCIGVIVGRGWRDNEIARRVDGDQHKLGFVGQPQMTAMLKIEYADGSRQTIVSDDSWQAGYGAWADNDIFNGVTYDARLEAPWSYVGFQGFGKAVVKDAPGGEMTPMVLPPILPAEEYTVASQWPLNGKCVMDFGQNLAGVIRLRIPKGLPAGTVITLTHSEELNENGELYTATLRSAKATDRYIVSGKESDDTWFMPIFTYHGFRYACVEGLGNAIEPDDIRAVALRNNLDKKSFFNCGSALVTKIHDNCVATERANTHGLLTDCPQRDERMGWMNDATVRFEAFPYRFESNAIFRKIAKDLRNDQGVDGAITCTAPLVFGSRPADPVCSSFLITGMQNYLYYNDLDMLKDGFNGWKGWADCLLAHSDDGIVNYSYYGDWAAPAYACDAPEGARSGVTPGIFMSTGYSYFNCRTVSEFATILGYEKEAKEYAEKAEYVKNAMLKKWYHADTKTFATGSQACQIFPLWLGIFPEEDAAEAAKKLRDELRQWDYKFTTGNLCTRYLFEVLSQYGYIDDAWALITKEDYPSFGYTIQQEATTIWERFELKKNAGMNSHSHPMYGAVYHWFYAYLAGIKPLTAGCGKVRVAPYFPNKLMSVHCVVDTVKGPLMVRWFKRYDKLHLLVNVPFGMTAEVHFDGQVMEVGSGFHTYEKAL
ncbi:MAG: family 78 glycoside hydrolase catalytic domain [Victivallales bacterium]|nr:family 78 glycoside hydrolase catalytic domain [Victivallales bacterium]